jgi:hypothetical protein
MRCDKSASVIEVTVLGNGISDTSDISIAEGAVISNGWELDPELEKRILFEAVWALRLSGKSQ